MHCVANTELNIDCLHPKLVALASFLQVSFILTELENEVFFASKNLQARTTFSGRSIFWSTYNLSSCLTPVSNSSILTWRARFHSIS